MSLFKRFELDNNICLDCGLKQYIKSLLGNEIDIIKIEEQSIILPNNKCIVDVWYNKLYISPIKTYYINKKDMKSYGDYTDLYIIEIDKQPVLLRMNNEQYHKTKDRIPISIVPLVNNNKNFYHYFASYQKTPLHGYSTLLRNKFNFPSVDVSFEDKQTKNKVSELYTEKDTIENYKKEITKVEYNDILGVINNVKYIKSFDQTYNSSSNVGYVFKSEILPNDDINGHIIIIPNRTSDLIFYYPNVSNMIYLDEIMFIKKFIIYDKNNLD